MVFSEFVQKLSKAIRGGQSTADFTRSVLEAIVNDAGQEILTDYSDSSFKGFYNGSTSVSNLAKKINVYLNPEGFTEYINQFDDPIVQKISDLFQTEIPEIDAFNADERLSYLLIDILTEAAGENKSSTYENVAHKSQKNTAAIETEAGDISEASSQDAFEKFLKSAVGYYSLKKTLLYPEQPQNFYDIYVCNDIQYHRTHMRGIHDSRPEKIIRNATVETLKDEARYIIIEGTGGIGKSM